ncbi:PF06250 domain protein [Leptospira kirschneri serovar Bim str. 1051]|uniref:DUF1016 N-terminal domain-containing protein n=1 Tax=Leptospira kirschneri TaxID=29507 RepID=UPI000287E0CF|nr:DUF1016 N-terminal domain-containing protein [Leptospira kirschneri]EMK19052.1 PF06250 domain protein [Leptospira kirschneri serovar Bim str. PUO 1247]EMN04628.1 PF06250 domain protein [Leptospira kirschneri serovar Bim str. 1051]
MIISNSSSLGLSQKSYRSLLTDISQIYESFQADANSDWNKISLVSYWKIGQRIVEVEQGNQERASYGHRVLIQLSKDLNKRFGKGFSDRNLRYMRRFFQFYKLGKIRPELSWTHYRVLLLVEDDEIRNGLEKEAIANGWSHRELLLKAQAVLRKRDSFATAETDSEFSEDGDKGISLLKRPILGLFTYRVIQNFSSNLEHSVPNLDLGFDVRIESVLGGKSKFPVGSIVSVHKNRKGYSFQKVSGNKLLYTYKAFLEKVVDGDTLLVTIDLGFHIFILQRLRLRSLDAPELGTKKGASSKKFVESQLKHCPFLLIKTYGSDKYDRYLVDVFYLKNEKDVSVVMQDGLFLNQEILNQGFADPI